ncbi:uncharacterized protein LOC118439443 isoform X1 [Folsomia candida]|uniref:uncharacterized protein LOC118439443 isoform X1 n=1 Tax=Folsomia candida TaxID=158441 RepID=UPI001604A993|nr:uncharacterized protein LOC118439443 isoform X1 [Folsomia candida]
MSGATNTEIQIIFKRFGSIVPHLPVPRGEITASVESKWMDVMRENGIEFNPKSRYVVNIKAKKDAPAVRESRSGRSTRIREDAAAVNLTETEQPLTAQRNLIAEDAETVIVPRKNTASEEAQPLFGQIATSSTSIRRPAFLPGDETTNQGNVIKEGEVQVSGLVRAGFARISNRDVS